jgi:hypothetical protein
MSLLHLGRAWLGKAEVTCESSQKSVVVESNEVNLFNTKIVQLFNIFDRQDAIDLIKVEKSS